MLRNAVVVVRSSPQHITHRCGHNNKMAGRSKAEYIRPTSVLHTACPHARTHARTALRSPSPVSLPLARRCCCRRRCKPAITQRRKTGQLRRPRPVGSRRRGGTSSGGVDERSPTPAPATAATTRRRGTARCRRTNRLGAVRRLHSVRCVPGRRAGAPKLTAVVATGGQPMLRPVGRFDKKIRTRRARFFRFAGRTYVVRTSHVDALLRCPHCSSGRFKTVLSGPIGQ